MRWVSCMAAMAVSAFAGPAAAAVTLVFDVNVTSAQGVSNFAPFSFQQTWTFGTGTVTPIFDGTRLGHSVRGSVSATGSSDGFNVGASSWAAFGVRSSTAGYLFETGASASPFRKFASIEAFDQDRLAISFGPDFQIVRYHKVTLAAASTVPFLGGPSYGASEYGLAAYLARVGTIAWRDEAGERFGDVDSSRRVYAGTMTLAPSPPESAVPEPASWALMIAGFGGVGAMARRRRPMRPAAGCGARP